MYNLVASEKEYESAIILTICFILAVGILLTPLLMPDASPIKAIIGEAEGEEYTGKLAVACAIRNRGNLKGVYGLNSRRVKEKLYSRDTLIDATLSWEESANPKNCEFIKGADSWDNVVRAKKTIKIGNHYFYKRGRDEKN